MDIDAFSAAHRDQWDRLDALASRRRLSGAEADELVALYRLTARHLSQVRTSAPDPQLVAELSTRLARARGRVTGTRESRASDLGRFLTRTMPAALYRVRWWTLGVTAASATLGPIFPPSLPFVISVRGVLERPRPTRFWPRALFGHACVKLMAPCLAQ